MAHVANAAIKEDIRDFELTKDKLIRNSGVRLIGQGDNAGDIFGVRIFQEGAAFNLAGYSVQGYFIRQDGTTVVMTGGAVLGNVAYVMLPQACYVYEGPFSLAIKIVGEITETIRVIDGVVTKTTTDTLIDPGSVVPDISQLLAKIQQMEQATQAANTAAANANTAAANVGSIVANPYSANTLYEVGQYVTYNGELYRCKVRVNSEEFTAEHWTKLKVGNELRSLYNNIAQPYNNQKTYNVGDYRIYYGAGTSGVMYKCTTAIETAEEWNSNHWTGVSITDELKALRPSVVGSKLVFS